MKSNVPVKINYFDTEYAEKLKTIEWYFKVLDIRETVITDSNISLYKHRKAKAGNVSRSLFNRDYQSSKDLELIFNHQFRKNLELPEGNLHAFIRFEVLKIEEWITWIALHAPDFRFKNVLIKYLEFLNEKSKSTNSLIVKVKTLQDIFKHPDQYALCLEALKEVNPPIISQDYIYLLGVRQKGAFTAWYEIIKLRQKLIPGITDMQFCELLNKQIARLNISVTTLGRNRTSAFNRYYSPLSKIII